MEWGYSLTFQNPDGGAGIRRDCVTTPLSSDGTFNNADGSLVSELPVELRARTDGELLGAGFCESVGFEPVEQFDERALRYLESVSSS